VQGEETATPEASARRSADRRSGARDGGARLLLTLGCGILALVSALPTSAARHAVLVLCPELTAQAVFDPASPFQPLLRRAAVAVMNPAVRGPRMPASAYLTLGAGERVAAGPLAEPARFPREAMEGDTAAVVYTRRIGPLRAPLGPRAAPLPALLHPGWAAFLNTSAPTLPPRVLQSAGGLGGAVRSAGVAWVGIGTAGQTRLGALTALDARGTVPWAVQSREPTPSRLHRLLRVVSLAVLDLPPRFDLSRLTALLVDLARDRELDLLLVSPYPPPGPTGSWDRLPPLLALGPDFPPGVLTSGTTRTRGLIANIDVAPTLLAALGMQVPETMRGRRMRSEAPVDVQAVVRFEREAVLAQQAIVPLGIGVGVVAVMPLLLALLGLWQSHRDSPRAEASGAPSVHPSPAAQAMLRLARRSLLLAAATPLALLLAPLAAPMTVAGAAAATAAFALAAALVVSFLCARRIRPLLGLYLLTAAVVAGDLLLGWRLVARSALSGYAVTGIRFYGLGNEYMGVLIGMSLLGVLAFEERLRRYRWLQAALFLGLVLLIGSPSVGADLGGALAAAAGFSAALILAWRPRRPVLALAGAAGSVLVAGAVILAWDAARPVEYRSHIGDFAHRLAEGGWSAAAPVLKGKAGMAQRLLTSGFALVPILGVAPLLGLWYHGTGRWLCSLLTRRSELRAAIGGAVVGSWAALLLNDSGISSWMFITVAALALLLDEQLRGLT
jgi:hypothetical protein